MSESVNIVRTLALQGLTKKEIAKESGLSYDYLTSLCKKHGIATVKKYEKRKPKIKTCLTPKEKQIMELRNDKKSYREIASLCGSSVDYVGQVCRKYGAGNAIAQQSNSIEKVISTIKQAGYKYISGYVKTHGDVIVECPKCHGQFKRGYHIFRAIANGTYSCGSIPECPICKEKARVDRKQQAEQQKHDAQEAIKEERKMRKIAKISRKANDELVKRLATHVCRTCGREFCIAVTGYNSSTYCSKYCQTNKYRKQHDDRRFKRMYGRAHDNDITLKKLYKRDNGKCYLCGCTCNWDDNTKQNGTYIAGPTHPSIDHVIPLSKGGLHVWDNVRLACMRCNASKSNIVYPLYVSKTGA